MTLAPSTQAISVIHVSIKGKVAGYGASRPLTNTAHEGHDPAPRIVVHLRSVHDG